MATFDSPIRLHHGKTHNSTTNRVRMMHGPTSRSTNGLQIASLQTRWEQMEERQAEEPYAYSTRSSSFSDVSTVPTDLCSEECRDGVLTLQGNYSMKCQRTFENCSKVSAHGAFLALSHTLTFDSPFVELEGNLTLWATAKGFLCLNIVGVLRVNSGSISVSGCKPDSKDSQLGGGIRSRTFIQEDGSISISNCMAKGGSVGLGGAIFTQAFSQTGGNLAIKQCAASSDLSSSGGAIYAGESFLQSGGTITIEDCTAFSRKGFSKGGAISSTEIKIKGAAHLTIRRCKNHMGSSKKRARKYGGSMIVCPARTMARGLGRIGESMVNTNHQTRGRKQLSILVLHC